MLRSFRVAARSWLAKLLFGLLILSFAAWGIEDMIRRAGPSEDPATVGDIAITREAVDVEFRRMVDRLRPMLGPDFTNEQAVKLGFVDQAVQTLAQRTLLRVAAESAGISVSDQMVRSQIAGDKGFQNQAGQFDAGLFMEILRRNNLSEQGYIALLRDDMARELLTSPVVSGAYAPKTLVQALFAHRAERRVVETVTLPHAAITDVAAADDATLRTYHAENPIAFTAPEYRKLAVAQLLLDDLAKEVKIAEADIAQAYEERRSEFETPERRKLRMAVMDDQAKAAALATAAAAQGLDAAAK
ncbi:MAG TPA: SurA N-terminal domain-containing protein, partial [Azospirillaceae bacterium]|nr:SurA N-terminal domain-containing protein [Azospirillaceae bacterium]